MTGLSPFNNSSVGRDEFLFPKTIKSLRAFYER
jgi:hypothetical protein